MPLTRISLRRGKSNAYKTAVMRELYEAMRETFDVPADDFFMLLTEHADNEFWFSPNYLNIERSSDLIIVQITVSNTRTVEKKTALYSRIVARLASSPGVRQQDVLINLLEVSKENWSFGNGEVQYT